MTLVKSAIIGAVLASAALLSGCSSVSSIDNGQLQDGIASGLTEQLGGDWTVTCPADQKLEKGFTFNCDVVSKTDGTTGTVVVTEEDDQGNITWKTLETAD